MKPALVITHTNHIQTRGGIVITCVACSLRWTPINNSAIEIGLTLCQARDHECAQEGQ